MSDTHPVSRSSLTLDQLDRIDDVCSDFAQQWKSGAPPRIEDYLSSVNEEEAPILLQELIQEEWHYRVKRADHFTLEEYQARFGDYRALIEALWKTAKIPLPQAPQAQHNADTLSAGGASDSAHGSDSTISDNLDSIPDYEIIREISVGGMGRVYLARHLGLKREVALKVILAGSHSSDAERERFIAEAESIALLQHPNVVQIFDIGEHQGMPYLALEYCPGGTLADLIEDQLPQPKEAARIIEVLARAVEAAHQQKVIHRDLKPGNVLLTETGELKLTDFGLAKRQDVSMNTADGNVLGTPSYMAPEQAGENSKVNEATDVYGLGAMLYELLVGRPPFRSPNPVDTVLQVLHQEPISPRQLSPGVPKDLETIVLKCLEKSQHQRYASAATLADELKSFQEGKPIEARPISRISRGWRWCKRNSAVASWMTVAALLLSLGTGVSSYFAVMEGIRAERETKAREDAVASRNQAIQDREEKTKALKKAEEARNKEATERKAKEAALERSRNNEKKALWNLYGARMFPMKAAWEARDFGELEYLLEQSVPKEGEPDFRGWEWYYFWDQCRQISHKLDGSFSHFGPSDWCRKTGRIALVNKGVIEIRDRSGQKVERVLRGRQGDFRMVAWSPDGKWLACTLGEVVLVWDTDSGTLLKELPGAYRGCLAWSDDGKKLAVSSHYSRPVNVWETRGWTLFRTFDGGIADLSWHPDNIRLAGASQGGSQTIVWDVSTGKKRFVVKKGGAAVDWSPDGKLLAAGKEDGLTILDANGRLVRCHPCNLESGTIRWSPDGKRVIAGGNGQTLVIWDQGLPHPCEVTIHGGPIREVCWAPDSARILVSGYHVVRILNVKADGSPALLVPTGGPTTSGQVCWSKDGSRICCSHSRGVTLLDPTTGKVLHTLSIRGRGGIAWQSNDSLVCYPPYSRRLVFLDAMDPGHLKVKREIDLQKRGGISTGYTPLGDTLAVGGNTIAIRAGLTIAVWNETAGKKLRISSARNMLAALP